MRFGTPPQALATHNPPVNTKGLNMVACCEGVSDETGSILHSVAPDEPRESFAWSLTAFASGVTLPWAGTLVWMAVKFLTS